MPKSITDRFILTLRPKIMLYDEVTSARDPELCAEVLGVMR
jgi:polar amino acid transport system ATP-binding protein